MAKVLLRYNGKRLPLSLTMPWLAEPLMWDNDTRRTIDVDSEDAERLITDGDGTTFVIESQVKEGVITKEEIAKSLSEGPGGVVKLFTALSEAPPDVEEIATADLQCPHCNHKPYKRQDFYDRHIATKHPEHPEVIHGNDNG